MNGINLRTIGIVGYGYVGRAVYAYFSKHYHVIYHDPYLTSTSDLEKSCSREDINNCDCVFVCVNTPSLDISHNSENTQTWRAQVSASPDGRLITPDETKRCDVSIVEEVVEWIKSPLICIKSTVEIGTTDRLVKDTGKKIVFSPEYLGESTYDTGPYNFNKDMKNHDYYIFGGESSATRELVDIFMPVSGPSRRYIQTDAKSAEMAKYVENCWLATKVVFSYEMDRVARAMDLDWNVVRELWLNDPRVTRSHTAVFKGNDRPFAGKCLPKDVSALIYSSEKNGYEPKFIKEVMDSNKRIGKIISSTSSSANHRCPTS